MANHSTHLLTKSDKEDLQVYISSDDEEVGEVELQGVFSFNFWAWILNIQEVLDGSF